MNLVSSLYEKLKPKKDLNVRNRELSKRFFNARNFFQKIGIILRLYGSYLQDIDPVFVFAYRLNLLIKFFRNVSDNKYNRFIIESFRNPFEIDFFRRRYYEFYLISIYAPFEIRSENYPFINDKELEILDKIDQGLKDFEDLSNNGEDSLINFKKFIKKIEKISGFSKEEIKISLPNTALCVDLSDIAISKQDSNNLENFQEKLIKYLLLILSPGCLLPSNDEIYMNIAYLFSLASTCISRKVGAVIVNDDGYVIGLGFNDVNPNQIGCCYRYIRDIKNNSKIFDYGCREHNFYGQPKNIEFFEFLLNESGFESEEQIEIIDIPFCFNEKLSAFFNEKKQFRRIRSLHAEENAILQTSKTGGFSLEGSTIYVTTFPCELCAKKIARVGIKRIVYVEPYPKSLSQKLFFEDNRCVIQVDQFEGVKPHSFYRLYKPIYDKKDLLEIIKIPRLKNLVV